MDRIKLKQAKKDGFEKKTNQRKYNLRVNFLKQFFFD